MTNTPLTHSEMIKQLREILKAYPFFTFSSIGKSLVGRDIPLITIGSGKKSVLYVGTHHGMEWITSVLLLKYLRDVGKTIAEKGKIFGVDAEELFLNRTVYIVPMLNPDGVELHINGHDEINPLTERLNQMNGGDFSKWQANGRGVDLNHNYNAGFDEYKKLEAEQEILPGPTRFSGAYPESEPECSALCSFIRSQNIGLLLALHTQGGEIYYDYNGHIPPQSLGIAKRMESISGYTLSKPEGNACYGGLKDWFIKEYDRPGFTIECGKGENPLPPSDCGIIYSVIRGILMLCPTFI